MGALRGVDTPDKHIVTRHQFCYLANFHLLPVFHFCGGGADPWNIPGSESVGSYRSVLELLHIPARKIRMDCVFCVGDQLSELRIIYRLQCSIPLAAAAMLLR